MTSATLEALADSAQETLLGRLRDARLHAGLTQADLAARTGLNRMTVQRAESCGGGAALSTFLRTALALGMEPALLSGQQLDEAGGSRLQARQAALANSWAAANDASAAGLPPVLETLLPGHGPDEANAVATVFHWLGSDIGFGFLRKALAQAGYDIKSTTRPNA